VALSPSRWLRVAEDLIMLTALMWAAACTVGYCGWDACAWGQMGFVRHVPPELVAWQRIQAVGVAWSGSVLASLISLLELLVIRV